MNTPIITVITRINRGRRSHKTHLGRTTSFPRLGLSRRRRLAGNKTIIILHEYNTIYRCVIVAPKMHVFSHYNDKIWAYWITNDRFETKPRTVRDTSPWPTWMWRQIHNNYYYITVTISVMLWLYTMFGMMGFRSVSIIRN